MGRIAPQDSVEIEGWGVRYIGVGIDVVGRVFLIALRFAFHHLSA